MPIYSENSAFKSLGPDDILDAVEPLDDSINIEAYIGVIFKHSFTMADLKRLMDIGCYRGLRHRRGLPPDGNQVHTDQIDKACRVGLCCSDRIRQKSDNEACVFDPAGDGIQSRCNPPSDALRESRRSGSSALCRLR